MASFNAVLVITLLLSLNYSCDAYSTKGFKNVAAAEERNNEVDRLGARKFMLDGSQWRKLKAQKDGEIVSTSSSSGASSIGNSSMKKREMEMEKIMSSTVINHQHDQIKNINPSGFMALNADYHMARPHPPRNN